MAYLFMARRLANSQLKGVMATALSTSRPWTEPAPPSSQPAGNGALGFIKGDFRLALRSYMGAFL